MSKTYSKYEHAAVTIAHPDKRSDGWRGPHEIIQEPTTMARKSKKPEARVYDSRKLPLMTPSMAGDEILRHFERQLETRLTEARRQMTSFQHRLVNEPAHAFEWSKDAFEAAGTMQVCGQMQDVLKSAAAVDDGYQGGSSVNIVHALRKNLLSDILSRAKYPPSSSSMQSNLMELCITSARTKLYEELTMMSSWYAI